MERFAIQAILPSALNDVASFVFRQAAKLEGEPSSQELNPRDILRIEERLQWLLVENPVTREGDPLGFMARDPAGSIGGVTLCFPNMFLAADQSLLGLCSGSFFVAPELRSLGLFLFKKYLNCRGYSLFFSTTCNPVSSALWEALGACAVENLEPEHILPFRLDTLLSVLMAKTIPYGAASEIARMFGRCGEAIPRFLSRRSQDLVIERSQDWSKLSALFRRYRPKEMITTNRSAEFLEWRYGRKFEPSPSGVYLFHDRCGNEGWFSLGRVMRGPGHRIRGAILLDAVWPREKLGFRQILPGILGLIAGNSDVFSLRPRPGFDYGECGHWFIRRKRAERTVFTISRTSASQCVAAALDLVPADGDGALPNPEIED